MNFLTFRSWYLIIFLIGFFVTNSYGSYTTVVRGVKFSGVHAFTEKQILALISIRPKKLHSPDILNQDIEQIRKYYQENGFYFVDIQPKLYFSDDSSTIDIIFEIDEGPMICIGLIEVEGNTFFQSDDILNQFETRVGIPLASEILERDIENLLKRYSRSGYPLAAVKVESIDMYDEENLKKLRIRLQIEENRRIQLREISIKGNKETHQDVILREVGISVGDFYNQDRVEKIRPRLNRLGIFSNVGDVELYLLQDGGGLLINFEEGHTNNFDGILGYVPGSAFGEKGFLTGLVSISMRNLFGTARRLHLRWTKDERYSQEIEVRYVEPWVFSIPLNLSCAFHQRKQDTIYVRRFIEGKTEFRLTDIITVGGFVNYENIIPSDKADEIVFRSNTTATGLELQIDTRDNIRTPTSGVKYRSDYQVGKKHVFPKIIRDIKTQTNIQKLGLDVDIYFQSFSRQVIALGIHGRRIIGDNLQISDMYRFGGTTTLRGYRENQFIGSQIAWINIEYRFIVERHSFLYGFFDTGYFLDAKSSQHFKYGYGIGSRVETGLGIVSIGFAFGKGDNFNQGKIHLGLINEF